MDMKLISATCSSLVSRPPLIMAASESNYKDLLRDIYDSEELKIESERCRALKHTIDELCTRQNTAFLAVFQKLEKEIDVKKKSVGNGNLYRACYMYQVERLPVLVGQLGKEHQEGSMNDCVLWQVATMHFVFS